MKLVVTGGTGFIGRPLCQALVADGHDLVVLTRRPHAPASQLRCQTWSAGWESVLDDAEGVINLAGEPVVAKRWTAAQKARIASSRIDTTRALVEAMRKAPRKPRVLINASAVGYYGPRGDELVTEQDPPGDDFLSHICQQWEAAAQEAEALGVAVVRLRIGIVLAHDGGALAKMLPAFRLGLGGPLGSGRQWMSWIHRDDVIGLIRSVLATSEHFQLGLPLNATAPNPVTMREFAKTLGRVLHRPAIAPAPAWVLRLALGEMAEMLLTGQKVIPAESLLLGYAFRYPTLSEALQACVAR